MLFNVEKKGLSILTTYLKRLAKHLSFKRQLFGLRHSNTNTLKSCVSPAFTIVELLVVIVVIGILAAITLVSYTGITQKAIVTTLQSDLSNASDQLKIYQAYNSSYPTALNGSNCPTAPVADNNSCLKPSSGNTFSYSSNGTTFTLNVTNSNGTAYNVTDNTTPVALSSTCPTGFIQVPGSATYGTNSFCVMKYEAKNDGSNNAISTASGYPWVSITQTSAITTAAAACTGCHLITEAEWMTIAQNVLSVASNWGGGSVGSGYIYSGHNDNAPTNALAADSNDSNGYAGETNTGGNQRRTLTLTNGQVIWDMAGNVYEWTNATIGANLQPGLSGEVAYAWKEWNNGSLLMNGLPYNSQPASTGVAGISGWSSTKGIGQLYSDYGETGTHAFLRGGVWYTGGGAGVLYLYLSLSAGSTSAGIGFRVSR